MALEHLFIGLPKIFREKSIYDRVHRGITIGQTVGGDPEEKGGRGQREDPKLGPEIDDVVWQPGDPKDHNHHQNCLCSLEEEKTSNASITTGKECSRVLKHALRKFCYHHGIKWMLNLPLLHIMVLFKTCPGPSGKNFTTYVKGMWIEGCVFRIVEI